MNALPPAPRRTNTRMLSSSSTRSHAAASAWYISQVIAFLASGRLKVRVAIGPSASKIVCIELDYRVIWQSGHSNSCARCGEIVERRGNSATFERHAGCHQAHFHAAERSGQHEIVEIAEMPDPEDFAFELS